MIATNKQLTLHFLEQESHHQIQFSVLSMTLFFSFLTPHWREYFLGILYAAARASESSSFAVQVICIRQWYGFVWLYGISTVVGYLMQNPLFSYILNIRFINSFCRYNQLKELTVLFLTIQFNKSWVLGHINHCRLFNNKSILYIQTVLFQAIQFSKKKSKGSTYCYTSPTVRLNIHLLHTVKCQKFSFKQFGFV